MPFEWDDIKRALNLAKHGLDLIRAQDVFDGRPNFTYGSPRDDEDRFVTIGLIGEKFYAVVWTARGPATRIISFRRARDGEERQYRALHG